jgi:hypothetical protein
MARPTKLTKELTEKAATYITETKMGGLFYGDLPTVAGLSIFLDVARDTLYEWAKLDTPLGREFSDTMERVSAEQEYKLIGKSLKGEYNSTISKLLLGNHGYSDRSEVKEKSEQTVTVITRNHEDE